MAALPKASGYIGAESTRAATRQLPDRNASDLLNKIMSVGAGGKSDPLDSFNRLETEKTELREQASAEKINASLNASRGLVQEQNQLLHQIIDEIKKLKMPPAAGGNDNTDINGNRPGGKRGKYGTKARERLERRQAAKRTAAAERLGKRAAETVKSARRAVTSTATKVTNAISPPRPTPEARPTVTPETRPGVTSGAHRVTAPPVESSTPRQNGRGLTASRLQAAGLGAIFTAIDGLMLVTELDQIEYEYSTNQINQEEYKKKYSAAFGSFLGSTAGAAALGAIGAVIGAPMFGIGSLVLGTIGGVVGSFAGSQVGAWIGETVASSVLNDSPPRAPSTRDMTTRDQEEIRNLLANEQFRSSVDPNIVTVLEIISDESQINLRNRRSARGAKNILNNLIQENQTAFAQAYRRREQSSTAPDVTPQQTTPMRPRGSSTSDNVTPYSRPSISGAQSETAPTSQQTQTQTTSGSRITGSPGRITAGITSTSSGSTPAAGSPQQSTGVTGDFATELNRVSSKFNVNPSDMLALMRSESSLNPQAVNASTGATGLIQFMPRTARSLGTTTEELRGMTAAQQMQYVEKYFDSVRLPSGASAGRLYAYVFLPGRANREVLTTRGEAYYDANIGLDMDRDGNITIADLDVRMARYGGALANASTAMAAADQAQARGAGTQVVVTPGSSGGTTPAVTSTTPGPLSEVPLNRRLEKQVA